VSRQKKLVISVHGVNSTGEWQAEVSSLISSRFTYAQVRYPHFVRAGFLNNVLDLGSLVLLGGVSWAIWWLWNVESQWKVLLWLAATYLSYRTFAAPVHRRKQAVEEVLSKIHRETEVHGHGQAPHVIAHSFGSYIMCRLLHESTDSIEVDRLLLWGTVVERGYDWKRPFDKKSVASVQNEQGSRDWVARLAAVPFWIRHMGCAGASGFKTTQAGVRNLPLKHEHSNAVRNGHVGHAKKVWMPYLLGLSHEEYRRFGGLCGNCGAKSESAIAEFDDATWSWTQIGEVSCSFREHTEMLIGAHLELHEEDKNKERVSKLYYATRRRVWTRMGQVVDHPLRIQQAALSDALTTWRKGEL